MSRESHSLTRERAEEGNRLLGPDRELIRDDMEEPPSGAAAIANLRLLWTQRVLLFRICTVGLVLSVLVAFLIPKRFTSTTRLMPPDEAGSGLATVAAALSGSGGMGGLASIGSDLLGLKSTSDVFVGILGSRTLQDKLIQQFDLKKVYGDRRAEDARKDLASNTAVTVERKSQIITIAVTDKSPQRAAGLAQAYATELDRLVSQLSTSSARRERIFLEDRLNAVSRDLEKAEVDFSQFASKNTAINIPEQGKAMVEAAAVLQGQLIAAESEREGLKQIYTENNVRVRTAAARVAELQAQLEKLGGKGDSVTGPAVAASDPTYPSIRRLPLLGVPYADLYRRTKVQETVFETLTEEYELAKVQEAKEIPTVKMLDPPDVPEKKSFPPRAIIVVLGTLLALTAGMTWIFTASLWDAMETTNPTKLFVREVLSDVKAQAHLASSHRSDLDVMSDKVSGFLKKGKGNRKGTDS